MPYFQNSQVAKQDDRRSVQRYVVDCEARFKMVGGELSGRLSDLSEAGARFDTQAPPSLGVSGMLEWADQSHFCKVIWSKDGSCGVAFERPISISVVGNTCETIEEEQGPVANFGNIPLGQKRSRRASLVSKE